MPPDQMPTIGRIVIYRSRTGNYDVPAVITATVDTLYAPGVELYEMSDGEKGVPPLTDEAHVHLTVLTPGLPGFRVEAADFKNEPLKRSENAGGSYQEWNIPFSAFGRAPIDDVAQPEPGTWRWPTLR